MLPLLLLVACDRAQPTPPVTIFAAASTGPALEAFFADDPGVRISVAGSGSLARQIELGAPADLFLSADPEWVTHLQRKGLVAARAPLLGNTLVLAIPARGPAITNLSDLLESSPERIALGDPESVPAGRYARDILRQADLWDALRPRLVYTTDVRHVLLLLQRGEVAAGFVYASDLRGVSAAREALRFDDLPGGTITCELTLLHAAAQRDEARAVFERLRQVAASDGFAAFGFTRPPAQLPAND